MQLLFSYENIVATVIVIVIVIMFRIRIRIASVNVIDFFTLSPSLSEEGCS
jgi:hypothetical protein